MKPDPHHVREVENLLATASEHDSRLAMAREVARGDLLERAREHCRVHGFTAYYGDAAVLAGCIAYVDGEVKSWEGAQ